MPHDLSRLVRPKPNRLTAIALATAGFLALGATLVAAVHTRLESSVPAADEMVTVLPDRFELQFSGPVNASLSGLVLVGPSGDSIRVELVELGGDGRTLVGEAPELAGGPYRVNWRTVSADGHPVSGEFGFTYAPGHEVRSPAEETGAEPPTGGAPRKPGSPQVSRAAAPDNDASTPGAGRTLLAGLALVSLLGFAGLLWFCGSTPLLKEPRLAKSARSLGSAALLLASLELVAWIAGVLPGDAGAPAMAAALGSGTGLAGLGQVLLVGTALAFLGRQSRVAAGLAMAAVLLGALSGHAASVSPWITMPANAVHVGGASIWLGGLLTLLLLPDAPSGEPGVWQYGAVVRAVSGAALLAVVLVAASGLIQSAWFVGSIASFTGTAYGRGILFKAAAFVVLLGFGAVHRRRTIPALEREGDSRMLRRTSRLETVIMLAVVMLAAWLAQASPPAPH
jgi:copper transport protein